MESTKYPKGFFIICESQPKSVGASVKDAFALKERTDSWLQDLFAIISTRSQLADLAEH